MRPLAPTQHCDRVLSDDELAIVWRASEALGYPFGPFVRLMLLTTAPGDRVSGIDWSSLDRACRQWSMSKDTPVNGSAWELPLSDLAMLELDLLALRADKFEGWPDGGAVLLTIENTPIADLALAKQSLDHEVARIIAARRQAVSVASWQLHDLRGTFARNIRRWGAPAKVVEAILEGDRGTGNGQMAAHERNTLQSQKLMALEAWSHHITTLLKRHDDASTA